MRFKFFPGSELSPPHLLGGIVDLDRPQHLVANLFLHDDSAVELRPVNPMSDLQFKELEDFTKGIEFQNFSRVAINDIMHYTTRHKAMC